MAEMTLIRRLQSLGSILPTLPRSGGVVGVSLSLAMLIAYGGVVLELWNILALSCSKLGLSFSPRFWAIRSILLVIAVIAALSSVGLYFWRRRILGRHLVSHRVRSQRAEYADSSWADLSKERLQRFYSEMRRPGGYALFCVAAVLLFALILHFLFWCRTQDPVPEPSYQVLWQVQTSFSAAAIPILMFVIRRSDSTSDYYGSDVPVLIRYTWVYPLMLFGMGAVIVTTIGLRWLPSSAGFVVGAVLLTITVVGTLYAFSTLIRLLADEPRLEAATERFIEEQFRQSLERSADRYLGTEVMATFLDRVEAQYSRVGPFKKDAYTRVPIYATGHITEVNLARLYDFLRSLPWKPHERPEIVSSGSLPEISDLDRSGKGTDFQGFRPVIFKKGFGDTIYQEDEAVVFLKSDAFLEIDVPLLSELLASALVVTESNP